MKRKEQWVNKYFGYCIQKTFSWSKYSYELFPASLNSEELLVFSFCNAFLQHIAYQCHLTFPRFVLPNSILHVSLIHIWHLHMSLKANFCTTHSFLPHNLPTYIGPHGNIHKLHTLTYNLWIRAVHNNHEFIKQNSTYLKEHIIHSTTA